MTRLTAIRQRLALIREQQVNGSVDGEDYFADDVEWLLTIAETALPLATNRHTITTQDLEDALDQQTALHRAFHA